jgi:hypothetical protein
MFSSKPTGAGSRLNCWAELQAILPQLEQFAAAPDQIGGDLATAGAFWIGKIEKMGQRGRLW